MGTTTRNTTVTAADLRRDFKAKLAHIDAQFAELDREIAAMGADVAATTDRLLAIKADQLPELPAALRSDRAAYHFCMDINYCRRLARDQKWADYATCITFYANENHLTEWHFKVLVEADPQFRPLPI